MRVAERSKGRIMGKKRGEEEEGEEEEERGAKCLGKDQHSSPSSFPPLPPHTILLSKYPPWTPFTDNFISFFICNTW